MSTQECAEPDGNVRSGLEAFEVNRHEAMLILEGQCPWCGEERP